MKNWEIWDKSLSEIVDRCSEKSWVRWYMYDWISHRLRWWIGVRESHESEKNDVSSNEMKDGCLQMLLVGKWES